MPQFSIGEVVRKVIGSDDNRVGGIVQHITCKAATKTGGMTCDRNNCRHEPKERLWVRWPDGKLLSYALRELTYDQEGETEVLAELQNMINSGNKEEAQDAVNVLNQLITARRNRETYVATEEEAIQEHRAVDPQPSSLFGMVKSDTVKAGYRVAAKQINTGMRNAFIEVIKKKGANNAQLEGVAMFLETDIGEALLATAAGYGLTYVPMISKNPRAQRLAKEFRVSGLATAGNAIVGTLIDQLMPIINGALNSPMLSETFASMEEVSENDQTKSLQGSSEEVEDDQGIVVEYEEIEPDQEILQALEEESKKGYVNGN